MLDPTMLPLMFCSPLSPSCSPSYSHIMRSTVLESTAVLFSNKRCILTLFVHISFHSSLPGTTSTSDALKHVRASGRRVCCKCSCTGNVNVSAASSLILALAVYRADSTSRGRRTRSDFFFFFFVDQLWAMQLSGRHSDSVNRLSLPLVFLTFFLAHYPILRLKRSHDRGGKSHWQLENVLYEQEHWFIFLYPFFFLMCYSSALGPTSCKITRYHKIKKTVKTKTSCERSSIIFRFVFYCLEHHHLRNTLKYCDVIVGPHHHSNSWVTPTVFNTFFTFDLTLDLF